MKIENGDHRITLIPENRKDSAQLYKSVPNASDALVYYTMDAGEKGNKEGLVITHRPDETTKEDILSLLGEGFHTGFRKLEVKNADEIHKLISDMPEDDWQAILEFVYEGIKEELKK